MEPTGILLASVAKNNLNQPVLLLLLLNQTGAKSSREAAAAHPLLFIQPAGNHHVSAQLSL